MNDVNVMNLNSASAPWNAGLPPGLTGAGTAKSSLLVNPCVRVPELRDNMPDLAYHMVMDGGRIR